jgi:hypothetical protein
VYAWFAGPSGADPDEMSLAAVDRTDRSQVLALMDVTHETGPLVVLAQPGDGVQYSPSLDRAADGGLVRRFDPLPLVDEVPTATVTTPITWDAGQVQLRHGSSWSVVVVTTGVPGYAPDFGPEPPDAALLTPCLTALGVRVEVDDQGEVTATDDPAPTLSSAEQADRDRATDRCWTVATGGA